MKRPKVPIPMACKLYGQPFLSKYTSEQIMRLQKHGFDWNGDRSYEEACKLYPNCKSSLKWFYNGYGDGKHSFSRFNADAFKCLREFLIENPPTFKISPLCCKYAKKDVSKDYIRENNVDLMCVGIRKSEGGIRAGVYKNCFSASAKYGAAEYRPVFWFKNSDKEEYEKQFGIVHSRLYTEYGFKRSGCAACSFGRDFDNELSKIQQFEPKLYKACNYIFGDSYAYTHKFREFQKEKKNEQNNNQSQ